MATKIFNKGEFFGMSFSNLKEQEQTKKLKLVNFEGFAEALRKKTKFNVTAKDVEAWCDGGKGFTKVDKAVRWWLGEKKYDEWDEQARLLTYVLWQLGVYSEEV